MELKREVVEFGLKNFFDLKYKNKELEYPEILELIGSIDLLKKSLNEQDKTEKAVFSFEKIEWLELLLNKYYRNDFTKFIDRGSIREYLFEKRTYGLEGAIFSELFGLANESDKDRYKKWLLDTKKQLEFFKKYKRPISTEEFLNGVSYEEFQHEKVKGFIKTYLTKELDSIFAQVHLITILGLYEFQKHTISKLKIDEIALFCVYEGKQITRTNGNDIAREFGHKSGEKLFQRYTYYSSAANRKAEPTPSTLKKLDNKINLFESVVKLLTNEDRERATDELSMLKTIRETKYL